MSGKQITIQQENLYMSLRKLGESQKKSAAKSGFSERSAHNVELHKHRDKQERNWRTRKDPLAKAGNQS